MLSLAQQLEVERNSEHIIITSSLTTLTNLSMQAQQTLIHSFITSAKTVMFL